MSCYPPAASHEIFFFGMQDVNPNRRTGDGACTRPKVCHSGNLLNFFRRRGGVALLEFAVIAIPFFMLIIGIVEVGLLTWAGYELENGAVVAARLVRTNQAQSAGYTAAQLQAQLCQNVVLLPNCASKVQLNVQTFTTFAGITVPNALDQNGALRTNFTYSPGVSGSIVLFTAYYEWPLTTPLITAALANLADGNYLLQSTIAFRNEP